MNENKVKYDVALSTLYFGLNYGSILTAFSLYKTVESYGLNPVMLPKPDALWTDHYANPESIANLFIRSNCQVMDGVSAYTEENRKQIEEAADAFLVGSDVIWNYPLIGEATDDLYFLGFAGGKKKVAYAPCFGGSFEPKDGTISKYAKLLRSFSGISVKEDREAAVLEDKFGISPEMVVDPVFLCDKKYFMECADRAVAKEVEQDKTFLFTSIENCDERKRMFLLRGADILAKNSSSPMRNFIDINRYPESKALLDLDVAYHIRVEDYLHYIINSEFVITDNYYAMCLALVFEKPFVVLVNEDFPELYRYEAVLKPLGLSDRMVILQSDLKKKEYLFRRPIRWNIVNKRLAEIREQSDAWLRAQLGVKPVEKPVEVKKEEEGGEA